MKCHVAGIEFDSAKIDTWTNESVSLALYLIHQLR